MRCRTQHTTEQKQLNNTDCHWNLATCHYIFVLSLVARPLSLSKPSLSVIMRKRHYTNQRCSRALPLRYKYICMCIKHILTQQMTLYIVYCSFSNIVLYCFVSLLVRNNVAAFVCIFASVLYCCDYDSKHLFCSACLLMRFVFPFYFKILLLYTYIYVHFLCNIKQYMRYSFFIYFVHVLYREH